MNKSLRTFSIIQKISLAKTINGIAYFFRKIPLVGSFSNLPQASRSKRNHLKYVFMKEVVFELHREGWIVF